MDFVLKHSDLADEIFDFYLELLDATFSLIEMHERVIVFGTGDIFDGGHGDPFTDCGSP